MMKGWILINPVLDPKSIKRSWVHHSSCGEVLEIVPSNEFQPFGPPPLAVSLRRSRHCLLHSPNSPLGFWTSVCETCSSSAHNDVHSPSCGLCSCTSHCLDGMANKPSRAAAPQTAAPKTPSSSRPFPDSLHVGASGRLSMLLHQGNASINCKFKCLPDVRAAYWKLGEDWLLRTPSTACKLACWNSLPNLTSQAGPHLVLSEMRM